MRVYVDDPHCMKESAKALNILYVYDRSYEPYLIHWLFPIQMAFSDQAGEGQWLNYVTDRVGGVGGLQC